MAQEVTVPSVGESISNGILATWLKQDGDLVAQGEEIFELETDKATMAVPSPAAGILRITIPAETEVSIGQVVARLEEGKAPAAAGSSVRDANSGAESKANGANDGKRAAEPVAVEGRILDDLAPAVRRLVSENRLDPASIKGTGKDGRITKEDVLSAMQAAASQTIPTQSSVRGTADSATASPPAGATRSASTAAAGKAGERRVPMTNFRKRIAENLVNAKQGAAHLTTFNEVDMSEVMALRKKYRDEFEKKHGVRLGFMSFFIKASELALSDFPEANAFIDGTDIVYHDYCNIGVAVSTERGLITPVIRNVESLGFADIERQIISFGKRAQEKRLSPDELMGGTFTITNGGVFGSMLSTPIPNPPQSAILGMHSIQDRPVALDGQVVIRPIMYVALTYDHRILDGREAIGFLKKVKTLIEDPALMLLNL
ncbi:MAG TPA: 2-oxoglutarate dehydrogenase complex dihydrolipoyllysine-residue succinyltransferase [Spirochaetia bacterium]|nr:2-oxoglutarate dehydrogenase complex dihydrolipoyllysine-residue succinyltransferase [Spirochaetia bacterium]